ncbi:MAG: SURF1 family protein [Betaproteobacteria bacterium]|nr:SURF1 family protein [Betaproteobacteria bacterium]
MTRKFRPTPIPTLAAVMAIMATVALGNWQRGRADEKRAVQAEIEARQVLPPLAITAMERDVEALKFRRIVVRGSFEPARQIFLDNKSLDNRVGVHVLTPFRVNGSGRLLLVNRGWLARPSEYPRVPDLSAPRTVVEVAGMAVPPIRRFVELSEDTAQGALWQNLTIDRATAHLGEPVFPLVLLADRPAEGLLAVTERPDAGIEKHQGYAFQWYALAALVAALWLGLNFRTVESA